MRYVRAQKWGGGGDLLLPPLPGKSGGERPLAPPPCSYAYVHNYSHVTVPVDPVPMTEKHKNIITSNYEKLGNLDADRVMVPLISGGIITLEDKEEISSEKTSKRKAGALLHLLVKDNIRPFMSWLTL